jgi:hypothetical protein
MAVNQTNQQPKMSQSNPPVIEQPSFPIEMPSRIIIMWGTVPPTNLRFLTAGVLDLRGCASMPCRLLLNHVKMQPKPSLTYLILNHVKMQPKPSLSYLRFQTASVLDLRGCDVYRWACRSIAIDVRLCHRGMMLGSYGLGSYIKQRDSIAVISNTSMKKTRMLSYRKLNRDEYISKFAIQGLDRVPFYQWSLHEQDPSLKWWNRFISLNMISLWLILLAYFIKEWQSPHTWRFFTILIVIPGEVQMSAKASANFSPW